MTCCVFPPFTSTVPNFRTPYQLISPTAMNGTGRLIIDGARNHLLEAVLASVYPRQPLLCRGMYHLGYLQARQGKWLLDDY